MSAKTSIEWTATVHPDGTVTPGKTWNPVTGCDKVSPGCAHCYAEGVANRFWAKQYPPVRVVTGSHHEAERPRQFTDVMTHEDRLLKPLSWRKPARVFVNSMSDLFHEDVPDAFIDRVFAVMALAPQHTFQILTKRPERMRDYLLTLTGSVERMDDLVDEATDIAHDCMGATAALQELADRLGEPWPLPNVWLGVSVENKLWRSRIDELRRTPAAVRFVSFEPLLEDVSDGLDLTGIDWAIWGGESGPGARSASVSWYRRGIAACRRYGVATFMKQIGAAPRYYSLGDLGSYPTMNRKGSDPAEWPLDIRVREFPKVRA